MSTPSDVICDYCKKPVEWREDFLMGVTWRWKTLPLHRSCALNVLSRRFFSKFTFMGNSDHLELISARMHLNAQLVFFALLIAFVVAGPQSHYNFGFLLAVTFGTLAGAGVFIPFHRRRLERLAMLSRQLYESRLPEKK
jgi:hypothetical protein